VTPVVEHKLEDIHRFLRSQRSSTSWSHLLISVFTGGIVIGSAWGASNDLVTEIIVVVGVVAIVGMYRLCEIIHRKAVGLYQAFTAELIGAFDLQYATALLSPAPARGFGILSRPAYEKRFPVWRNLHQPYLVLCTAQGKKPALSWDTGIALAGIPASALCFIAAELLNYRATGMWWVALEPVAAFVLLFSGMLAWRVPLAFTHNADTIGFMQAVLAEQRLWETDETGQPVIRCLDRWAEQAEN
jgi:hypothetical protein